MTFGETLELIKTGKFAARDTWDINSYIWLLPEAKVPATWCKETHLKKLAESSGGEMHCLASIRLKTVDNKVLTGWSPSQSDMFATDWKEVIPT